MSLRSKTATRVGRLRQYPRDLAAVSIVAVAAAYLLTEVAIDGPVRLLIALPLILFLPGYALVSALFPAAARRAPEVATGQRRPRGIDTVERVGLSLALSLAVAPAIVMGLAVTEWGLGTEPIAIALAGATVVLAQAGVVRRLRVPGPDRYTVSPRSTVRAALASRDGTLQLASTTVLAAAILVAAGALTLAFVAPLSAGEFTQLGLYTEDDDGDLVAGDLPSEVAAGESIPLTVGVENHEGETTDYTLVVQEQYHEDGAVTDRTELETVEVTVDDGETERIERSVTPTAQGGETVRIAVLLFEGEPPAEPTIDTADEDTFFWVTVDDGAADDG